MKIFSLVVSLLLACSISFGQAKPELTVEKIMRDPKSWIGISPSKPFWSEDSKTIYFDWNPEANTGDSLYKVQVVPLGQPVKVQSEERTIVPTQGEYSKDYTRKLFAKNGDIFILNIPENKLHQVTNTLGVESEPKFTGDANRITYMHENNLFSLDISNGQLIQLTDFKMGSDRKSNEKSKEDEWLERNELSLIKTLQERKDKKEEKEECKKHNEPKRPKTFYLDENVISNIVLSPDEKFITFILRKGKSVRDTYVPNYITESGYTEKMKSRPKVGFDYVHQVLGIYNLEKDTIYFASESQLPGIDTPPHYRADYKQKDNPGKKNIMAYAPKWSDDGKNLAVILRSFDNKDRWIARLDLETGSLQSLDHQYDEAWIGGPGIGWLFSSGSFGWMPDHKHIWFQSEESGYSHLYVVDITTKNKRALTTGRYEVDNVQMSRDKRVWYFEANIAHPGDRQLYAMPVWGGKIERLTTQQGKNATHLSPDEKRIAIIHSTSNRPWELYVMDNPVKDKSPSIKQLTFSTAKEFNEYPWRKPEVISFRARDSVDVYARLYRPDNANRNGAAVIFVHGAGYLQNAHFWWSSYFREYMFNNLLADKGYTVLDIDYRGSAGYGRDFRTANYRHMGSKDLTDHVDGAAYLVDNFNIDPKRIGLYGGSYGGFITLMAMFNFPDAFAAGAALRSVTDWSHYNHPYTSSILNTPTEDSLAFRRSSPIYYAEGLKGALLMCHGMVDTNVHFQDIVRLSQRLIELGKSNWELAVYPMEDHAFVEPSSWTDEYKRVLKLFEQNLNKANNTY
jgi:dipeptidyl aminopeptidase/acylaminoacyl peptidase